MPAPFRRAIAVLALLVAVATAEAQIAERQYPPDSGSDAAQAQEELRRAVRDAGNDSEALISNLEDYLRRFPATPARASIYPALVEAEMELDHQADAVDYAERLIALQPDDAEMMLFAIRLLRQRGGDEELRRATSYATRILERLAAPGPGARPPGMAAEEWERSRSLLSMIVYLIRGELHMDRHDYAAAEVDLEGSYRVVPNPQAALRLGELYELSQRYDEAIDSYAAAFVIPDQEGSAVNRADVRRKLGNLWRARHGTAEGLGERLLGAYDEVSDRAAGVVPPAYNAEAAHLFDFVLRRAGADASYRLSDARGRVIVLDFWATWCATCREFQPLLEQVRRRFAGHPEIVFLAVSYDDEDEVRIREFLEQRRISAVAVHADGLDRLLDVDVVPAVVILDRQGRMVFRGSGFTAANFVDVVGGAIERALGPFN